MFQQYENILKSEFAKAMKIFEDELIGMELKQIIQNSDVVENQNGIATTNLTAQTFTYFVNNHTLHIDKDKVYADYLQSLCLIENLNVYIGCGNKKWMSFVFLFFEILNYEEMCWSFLPRNMFNFFTKKCVQLFFAKKYVQFFYQEMGSIFLPRNGFNFFTKKYVQLFYQKMCSTSLPRDMFNFFTKKCVQLF